MIALAHNRSHPVQDAAGRETGGRLMLGRRRRSTKFALGRHIPYSTSARIEKVIVRWPQIAQIDVAPPRPPGRKQDFPALAHDPLDATDCKNKLTFHA